MRPIFKRLTQAAAATTALVGGALVYSSFQSKPEANYFDRPLVKKLDAPKSRESLLSNLNQTEKFDLLVIGGGATGTGVAVDAQTRGLNVCLLERHDFGSGTSSKSTKMVHGGVRYLEKAFFQLSKAQLDLVIEALNERSTVLTIAPHLSSVLPILIPVYKYWQIPYFYVGCKMYDLFAGSQNLRSSMYLTKDFTKAIAPMLNDDNLKCGLVYHDGSFNDARLNATLALTAVDNGATVLNYMNVKQLIKSEDNKVLGAIAVDQETGKEYTIKATSTVNATGPFADVILEMDNDVKGLPPKIEQPPKMVVPSSGVHIVLPEYFCPKEYGLLDPSTEDGRVMFFLPWQGKVLAGTTDTFLKKVDEHPIALEEEILDILGELQKYLKFPVERKDVLSAWSGIRPLVRDPSKIKDAADTQGIVRSHLLYESETGLITISGGKWTTYREMSEETVNKVVKDYFPNKINGAGNEIKPCQTKTKVLVGGEFYDKNFAARLVNEYNIPIFLAEHLASNYGTRAPILLEIYKSSAENQKPICFKSETFESFSEPFTVAELKYTIKYEYARNPIDFLMRRTRLAFLDAQKAYDSIDLVVDVMSKELNWSSAEKNKWRDIANDQIAKMGLEKNTVRTF